MRYFRTGHIYFLFFIIVPLLFDNKAYNYFREAAVFFQGRIYRTMIDDEDIEGKVSYMISITQTGYS